MATLWPIFFVGAIVVGLIDFARKTPPKTLATSPHGEAFVRAMHGTDTRTMLSIASAFGADSGEGKMLRARAQLPTRPPAHPSAWTSR